MVTERHDDVVAQWRVKQFGDASGLDAVKPEEVRRIRSEAPAPAPAGNKYE